MYDKGTAERQKMLYALWRMRSQSNTQTRYINARAYEKLKIEFSEIASKNQSGLNNSRYGTKWYTNRNTGESRAFKESPVEDCWLAGRNLFNGQTSSILQKTKNYNWRMRCQQLWDEYHASDYTCISAFGDSKGIIELRRKFRRYIPIFARMSKDTVHNRNKLLPNKELIGHYER